MLPQVELITRDLKQAVEIMGIVMKEMIISVWPTDPEHPCNQLLSDISRSILDIKLMLLKKTSRYHTTKVIRFLKKSKVDYTLLLYLQLPESIQKRSELLCYLQSICTQMGADSSCKYFYDCVWRCFEEEGIVPITMDKYITATKKDEALEEYAKISKKWGNHMPLFFQTYRTSEGKFVDNVYHITRTVSDGIIRLLDILKLGEFVTQGKAYKAVGAFEHVIGPSTLTCPIYDCEIMSHVFEGRKSVEEIKEMVQSFPQCICSTMVGKDLIEVEKIVTFTVKSRTRQVGKDNTKVSYHFVPNICAPKAIHVDAMELCLQESKATIDEADDLMKKTKALPERFITNTESDSLLSWDYSAFKGNGFTTAFSRKKPADPFSCLAYMEIVCAGQVDERHEFLNRPQDLHSTNLTDQERLKLIHTQLYTAPKVEMISFTDEALAKIEKQVFDFYFYLFIIF